MYEKTLHIIDINIKIITLLNQNIKSKLTSFKSFKKVIKSLLHVISLYLLHAKRNKIKERKLKKLLKVTKKIGNTVVLRQLGSV